MAFFFFQRGKRERGKRVGVVAISGPSKQETEVYSVFPDGTGGKRAPVFSTDES